MTLKYEEVAKYLEYDENTGDIIWIDVTSHCNVRFIGRKTGHIGPGGYVRIKLWGKLYLAHRVAFLLKTGDWPPHTIDHINGVRHDNRWSNLRCATFRQNSQNQKLHHGHPVGLKGVSWDAIRRKWRAQIRVNGRLKHLGMFACPELAHAAYCEAARIHFGEFARTS